MFNNRGKQPHDGSIRVAAFVDSLGGGLVMTLTVLFFVLTTDIPLAHVGFAVAAGGVVALPVGLAAGWLIDLRGSKFGMVLNNILAALGFGLYLLAENALVIFLASLLIAIGDRLYWAAWTTYVHDLSTDQPYEKLFGRLEAAKMAAMGIGAAAAAVALAINAPVGAYIAVTLNIVVTLIAAVIYAAIPMPKSWQSAQKDSEPSSDARGLTTTVARMVRQPGFLSLTLGQFLLSPIMVLPNVALSVFFVQNWELNAAVAPVLFGINAALVALLQERVTHFIRFRSRASVILIGAVSIAVMVLALAVIPAPGTVLGWIIVALVGVVLAGVDMLYMPATNALMSNVPTPELRGRSVGVFQTAMAVGMAIYPSTVGLLEVNPGYLWALTAVACVGGGICYVTAARRGPDAARYGLRKALNNENSS